ncbi:MAG: class IV adenylate cyclase [Phycisphaerales bacterium]|nr:class IV adenylate cyclase [Planctomycetota bacterium]
MRNVEFKAELRDLPLAMSVCLSIGAKYIGLLEQTDTYYRIADARLKKRETVGEPPEWIFYERPDTSAPKLSRFTIYSEAEAAERFGVTPPPTWVVVKKARELLLLGNVRIHLDMVRDLGCFIELEAMVTKACGEEACRAAVAHIRSALGPLLGEPISCGYSDMLDTVA